MGIFSSPLPCAGARRPLSCDTKIRASRGHNGGASCPGINPAN